jgi:hypothetical protein
VDALVVYESMFGNTRDVAVAIADGLSAGMEVTVVEVGSAPTEIGDDVALLVVGGPTHAFSMSRPTSREDAAKETEAGVVSTGIGLREWLVTVAVPAGLATAAFDTKVNRPLTGSAATAAAKRLKRRGLRVVAPPADFYVLGKTGPLDAGEVERARRWGEALVPITPEFAAA